MGRALLPFVVVTAALVAPCLLAACGGGETAHLVADPAALQFGRVIYGENATGAISLKNTGSATVFISSAKGNCACFRVGSFLRTLRPGDRTEVPVQLISKAGTPDQLRGKRLDVVYAVFHDEAGHATQELHHLEVPLEGEILLTHTVKPERLTIVERPAETSAERPRIRVRPGRGFRLELTGATVDPRDAFTLTTEAAEGGVDIVVEVKEREGPEVFEGVVTIRTAVTGEGFEPRRFENHVPVEVRR